MSTPFDRLQASTIALASIAAVHASLYPVPPRFKAAAVEHEAALQAVRADNAAGVSGS